MTNRTELNIKMDLLRVAKTALDVDKPFNISFANMFLNRAIMEVEHNLKSCSSLKDELISCKNQIPDISTDNIKRIHWGEKIMTIAFRLGTL